MVQFKVEDVSYFKTDKHSVLRCLPCSAPFSLIMTAKSATLKLDNQKNSWKGAFVHQEANGEAFNCSVRALARWIIHVCENSGDNKTLLLAFYVDSVRYNFTGDDISKGLKMAATLLSYPATQGIPVKRVDTHLL